MIRIEIIPAPEEEIRRNPSIRIEHRPMTDEDKRELYLKKDKQQKESDHGSKRQRSTLRWR